jgi:hypothetical protein
MRFGLGYRRTGESFRDSLAFFVRLLHFPAANDIILQVAERDATPIFPGKISPDVLEQDHHDIVTSPPLFVRLSPTGSVEVDKLNPLVDKPSIR